jgi:cytochrome c5
MAALAIVVSGQQPAAPASPAPAEKSPQQLAFERFQRAERVMNLSCSDAACHTIRPIQTAAMDEAGWMKTIAAMVEKGAKIAPDDLPILTEYLVRYHGPLPDGDGKAIMLNICTLCHDLQRVRSHRSTVEGWKELIDAMIFEGAPLPDDAIPVLLTYLARNFHE